MLPTRAHVLPDGGDAAAVFRQIRQHALHLFVRFTQPDHKPALGNAAGFPDTAQQFQTLEVISLGPDAAVMGRRGFHIMIDDLRGRLQHRAQGRMGAAEIRNEHLDGWSPFFTDLAQGPDAGRKMSGPAVEQVIAGVEYYDALQSGRIPLSYGQNNKATRYRMASSPDVRPV